MPVPELQIKYPTSSGGAFTTRGNKLHYLVVRGRADTGIDRFKSKLVYTAPNGIHDGEEVTVRTNQFWILRSPTRVFWWMRIKLPEAIRVGQTATLTVKGFDKDYTTLKDTKQTTFSVVSPPPPSPSPSPPLTPPTPLLEDILNPELVVVGNIGNSDDITDEVDGLIAIGDLSGGQLKTVELIRTSPPGGQAIGIVSWFSDPDDLQLWAVQFDTISRPLSTATQDDFYQLTVTDFTNSSDVRSNLRVRKL